MRMTELIGMAVISGGKLRILGGRSGGSVGLSTEYLLQDEIVLG